MNKIASDLASIDDLSTLAWLNTFKMKQALIESWFDQQFSISPAPLYSSVDLRFSGYKLAPVDTNLFPAGFNNISEHDYPLAIATIKTAITQQKLPTKWLLIPENHTRNIAYWENVHVIQKLFMAAGCEVEIGSLLSELKLSQTVPLNTGKLTLHPLDHAAEHFQPEAILLNNDLAEGLPTRLQNLPYPIHPPAKMGWYQRRKSRHAAIYSQLANEFAAFIELDPWLISTLETTINALDLDQQPSIKNLAEQAQALFEKIRINYDKNTINQPVFIMMKADAGTYGQAVMSITAPETLLTLNRKQKQTMRFTKGKQPVTSVLLQEGVYTREYFPATASRAEPVIYFINGQAIGGFYRINDQQNDHDNLNKPGMQFSPFSLTQVLQNSQSTDAIRGYAYTTVARLAVLAAAREIQEINS